DPAGRRRAGAARRGSPVRPGRRSGPRPSRRRGVWSGAARQRLAGLARVGGRVVRDRRARAACRRAAAVAGRWLGPGLGGGGRRRPAGASQARGRHRTRGGGAMSPRAPLRLALPLIAVVMTAAVWFVPEPDPPIVDGGRGAVEVRRTVWACPVESGWVVAAGQVVPGEAARARVVPSDAAVDPLWEQA